MKLKIKKHFWIRYLLIFWLGFSSYAYAGMATFNDRRDVQNFIHMMVAQYNYNGVLLNYFFSKVQLRSELLRKVKSPKEILPWSSYRGIAVNDTNINNGLIFWNQHAKTLAEAEKRYGVPADIIVSILGVETKYGKITGNYGVFNTLATLGFSSSPRAPFFRKELAQFLLLARELNFNPMIVTGSYAGAMGFPQFMPSSYRTFAISAIPGTKPDLFSDPNDAILSIANYFQKNGWQAGQDVALPLPASNPNYQKFATGGLQTKYTVQQLAQAGIKARENLAPTVKANLIVLNNPNAYEYWLGLNNFYVITAYNNSQNYAMAVYQLATEIQKKRRAH